MKKILNISIILLIAASIAGCSSLRFPGVYRLQIHQGNYLEQKNIDKLKVGMTRNQVRYVMGTPLVQDTFAPDRWDYYFSIRHNDKTLREYHFTALFDGNTLSGWKGDYEPTAVTEKDIQEKALKTTKEKEDAKFKKNDNKRF